MAQIEADRWYGRQGVIRLSADHRFGNRRLMMDERPLQLTARAVERVMPLNDF